MIKIAVLADIHLNRQKNTVQYDAFEFALNSIKESEADIVICLGDVTAFGDVGAANYYIDSINQLNKTHMCVLGNSDIRDTATIDEIKILVTKNDLMHHGLRIIGIDTSSEKITQEDMELLKSSDENTLVFMHHPYDSLDKHSAEFLKDFQENANYLAILYGHLHYYKKEGRVYAIQALDPDKSIDSPSCVTYLEIEGKDIKVELDYFGGDVPEQIDEFLGLSCFKPEIDIPFAIANNIKNIELRPNAVYDDRESLIAHISEWRKKGGKYLSLHMPDFGYDEAITGVEEWQDAVRCANELGVNGVTVHVPKTSVCKMQTDVSKILVDFITDNIKKLPENCIVGIENMHMTAKEQPDSQRRFGYTPSECVQFINMINDSFGFDRVGSLLDVGHARNNAPYSSIYPLGVWYSEVGKHTVAYHIHQIEVEGTHMENHMPVKSLFGPLISYCGFSYCWNRKIINRKPLFLEIRGGIEKYSESVKFFKN